MININGTYISGNNITITKNRVIIDGVDVTPDSKVITITVDGNIDEINADYCQKILVNGNVRSITATSGDIECKEVSGDIKTTSGDIECENVCGSVNTTSGDVKCGNVTGNVKTLSGDIRHK